MKNIQEIFKKLGLSEYAIIPIYQIFDSHHNSVLPIEVSSNTKSYSHELDKKALIYFDRPLWTAFDIYLKFNKTLDYLQWTDYLSNSIDETALKIHKKRVPFLEVHQTALTKPNGKKQNFPQKVTSKLKRILYRLRNNKKDIIVNPLIRR